MQQHRKAAVALVLLAALLHLPSCSGLKSAVYPGAVECFTETLGAEHFTDVKGAPRVEGAFFVASRQHGFPVSLSATLYSPSNDVVWSQVHIENEAHFNVAARGPGAYRLCFQSNSRVDASVDLVYLTMGHLRRPGQVNVPKGTEATRGKELARKDHLEEVKRNVLVVGELVDILSGEQRYLQRKLERHMQTCRSNSRRTLWYTLLEVAVLCGVGVVNVLTVSSFFKGPSGPRSYGGGRLVV